MESSLMKRDMMLQKVVTRKLPTLVSGRDWYIRRFALYQLWTIGLDKARVMCTRHTVQ
jgi:hypothetical protein